MLMTTPMLSCQLCRQSTIPRPGIISLYKVRSKINIRKLRISSLRLPTAGWKGERRISSAKLSPTQLTQGLSRVKMDLWNALSLIIFLVVMANLLRMAGCRRLAEGS